MLERVRLAVCRLDAKVMSHVRKNVIWCTATCVEIVAGPFRKIFYLGGALGLIIWYLVILDTEVSQYPNVSGRMLYMQNL